MRFRVTRRSFQKILTQRQRRSSLWHEGSVGQGGLIIIQPIEELGLGGARGLQRLGPHAGGGAGGQLVVGGGRQGLLGCWVGWLQPLQHKEGQLQTSAMGTEL